MKLAADATLSLAPTDLSNHLACQHVTMLELAVARGDRTRPTAGVPNQQALQEKGLAHEAAYVAHLKALGLSVTDLRGAAPDDEGFARTCDAMRAGVDVIVQAPLVLAPSTVSSATPSVDVAATAATPTVAPAVPATIARSVARSVASAVASSERDGRAPRTQLSLFDVEDEARETREADDRRDAQEAREPHEAPAARDADAPARWSGRADVLRRVDTPSALGVWSYEIVDTKLARDTRGAALLQLCTYSAIIDRVQALMPAHVHIVSPGDQPETPFETHTFRLDEYLAYYRAVRARFEAAVRTADADATYPEPTPLCDVCRWWTVCDTRRRTDDHLSLVAGVTKLQMHELREREVETLERLALLPSPLPFTPARGSAESLSRTHGQARVQLDGRRAGRGIYELLPLEPDRGLSRLPPPSPGDIFFDLEGDPFVGPSGHEYLFGWAARDLDRVDTGDASQAGDDALVYTAIWAEDAAAEKAAFQRFIAFVHARLERYPDLHIYHYAPYESGALRRLMGRHATCEAEVDRLLRGNTLVDLHTVVRQSVRASVERYSIKELEIFYDFARATPLREAAAALRRVEYLLETGQPLPADDAARVAIERYNRDDCVSAAALRDWLEARRDEHEAAGRIVMRPVPPPADPSEALSEKQAQVRALMDALLTGVPDDPAVRTAEEQGCWLLAHLLDFHRREEKSAWWEFYRLADLPEEERRDESKALVDLTFDARLGGTKRCPIDRYTFTPQECDLRAGDELWIAADSKLGTIEAIDRDARLVEVKKTTKNAEAHPASAFSKSIVPSDALAGALLRLGTTVAADGFAFGAAHAQLDGVGDTETNTSPSAAASNSGGARVEAEADATAPRATVRAACNLLLQEPPRLAPGTPWTIPGESTVARARRLALALDGGVLPIQGPPGAGKTYAGARIICELVAAGKKVAVTGPNHSVIGNLLDGVVRAADEEGLRVRCIQKAKEDADVTPKDDAADPVIRQVTKNPDVLEALQDGSAQIGAGTPWLWAREEFAGSVDVLVIDEAGQMSLANALAMAGAARGGIVLLGDPQQLEQPLQGSHPDGAAVSVLQHVLGDHQTVPDARGLFLGETWRLHPSICTFTSEVFYERRLSSHTGLDGQRLAGDTPLAGAGLWFLPVPHTGNQNSAPEEVDAIADLVAHLLGDSGGAGNAMDATGTPATRLANANAVQWIDATGAARPLTLDDILIVAPYNAQVYAIRDRLPGVRVGTVDRFQGQEAPLVIYSMTTSSPEDAPRGMEFLYSLNRLNVATSRAQGVVILLASPRLLEPDCQTPRQMRLANAFCRYVELATPLSRAAFAIRESRTTT